MSASSFPTDCSKVVSLLQFDVVFALEVLFNLSFFWCVGKAVPHDCGICYISLLILLLLLSA